MDVLVDGEILLFGTVGDDFFMDGFSAMDVVDALSRVGRGTDVTVRINSGGGYASEGVAIFNALKAHRGAVAVIVESIAASAASLIAMAGKTVKMRNGSVMMIHDPSAVTIGTSADHEKSVEALEALASGYADVYAEKSGRTPKQTRNDMKSELWLTADQAVELGYANEVDRAPAFEPTAFDFRVYQHSPERLTALAAAKGWKFKARAKAENESLPPPKRQEEISMPKTETEIAAEIAAAAEKAKTEGLAAGKTEGKTEGVAEGAASARADAVEIVTLSTAAGVPAMAAALIKEGVSLDVAKQRIASAKDIRDAVALGAKTSKAIDPKLADAYIAAGASLEHVRADLFQKMAAAQSPEINGNHSAAAATAATDASALFAKVTAKLRQERGEKRGVKAA